MPVITTTQEAEVGRSTAWGLKGSLGNKIKLFFFISLFFKERKKNPVN
jgi:hypothetical protein